MLQMDRRAFVLSSAAAAAGFGLSGSLEIVPSALAQAAAANPLNPKGSTAHKFKIGSVEVTTVFEGGGIRDLPIDFVKNAAVADVNASLKASGLDEGKLPNAYTLTVVKIGQRTIMFDSGFGTIGPAGTGQFAANLTAAGIDPASITTIAVTHFHPDHIFGLFTKDNAQVFPNVEIVVPETEYRFWSDPAVIAQLPEPRRGIAQRVQATMPQWKNLRQVAADKDVVPGIRALATNGHSPGHTSYFVDGGSAQMLVLGDLTTIPAINMRNPGWHVVFDQDANMAEASRRKMFDRAVADKVVCTGYHWGMPGAGTVVNDGNGYALVPVA